MKKRILVINNEKSMSWGLSNSLIGESVELTHELHGDVAYQRIKEISPDLLLINLETPGLVKSWVDIQLDGVEIARQIPTIATSKSLSNEEREVLSDLTGVKVLSSQIPLSQLETIVEAALLQ
jgi:DNA-binding NarL/FixJ family response regulator